MPFDLDTKTAVDRYLLYFVQLWPFKWHKMKNAYIYNFYILSEFDALINYHEIKYENRKIAEKIEVIGLVKMPNSKSEELK